MQTGRQSVSAAKSVRAVVLALLFLMAWRAGSQVAPAGPPLITDDPETPGRGGWEINVSHNIEATQDEFLMETPLFDINYGLIDTDQWKIEFPVVYLDSDETGSHWGMGDLSMGWKYRFREEDHGGMMASIYPQLSTPTGNTDLGLGSGHTEAFLPVQLGKHFLEEKLFVYGELGYNVVFGEPEANSWKYGVAAQWQATEKLALMGEVGGFAFPGDAEIDDVFFNFGLKRDLTEHVALIASFGRSFRDRDLGTPDLLTFVGLQITRGGCAAPESEQDASGRGGSREREAGRSFGRRPRWY